MHLAHTIGDFLQHCLSQRPARPTTAYETTATGTAGAGTEGPRSRAASWSPAADLAEPADKWEIHY
jgi:hypothetical protein